MAPTRSPRWAVLCFVRLFVVSLNLAAQTDSLLTRGEGCRPTRGQRVEIFLGFISGPWWHYMVDGKGLYASRMGQTSPGVPLGDKTGLTIHVTIVSGYMIWYRGLPLGNRWVVRHSPLHVTIVATFSEVPHKQFRCLCPFH